MGPTQTPPVRPPEVRRDGPRVRVAGDSYAWTWSAEDDAFQLDDAAGRRIVSGQAQPLIRVVSRDGTRTGRLGIVRTVFVEQNVLRVDYEHVDNSASVSMTWRFDRNALWLEPMTYHGAEDEAVESVHYFSTGAADAPVPTLSSGYLVQPGLSASTGLGPVVDQHAGLSLTSWLGRGSTMDTSVAHQQWALPVHYFCGVSMDILPTQRNALLEHLSDAFCCGLADLPAGDLKMTGCAGCYAPVIDMRGDLWGGTGPAPTTLGATWCWTVARGYREAIRAYYAALVEVGLVEPKRNSEAKNAVMALPQFNTWGAQAAMGKQFDSFDEQAMLEIYGQLRSSGMQARCFVIDDKWEGRYGLLEHSEERFPNFEQVLDDFRAAGNKIGMWAAFLRCEDPAAMGLDLDHMLRAPDGSPLLRTGRDGSYYLFDITQDAVQKVLQDRARRFVRRYRPDLVKFDFGYELPSLAIAAPMDLSWAGERLLRLGLDIVIGAMREENPDLVVMYYSLSPLFLDHLDLHSMDDLWLAAEEYHLEVNRRLFFSSLLGELGMPSYGSGGYDWLNIADIWFDTVVCGSPGSLGSFAGDPLDSHPTPRDIAKYNGLSMLVRPANVFSVQPLQHPILGGSTAARSSSWVRRENGEPVTVALRVRNLDGSAGVTEYDGLVRTDVSVVVASATEAGIATTSELRLVPYGDGAVSIRHDGRQGSARVTTHCLGGGTTRSEHPVAGGWLRLPVVEVLDDGAVVERMNIDFV